MDEMSAKGISEAVKETSTEETGRINPLHLKCTVYHWLTHRHSEFLFSVSLFRHLRLRKIDVI